MPAKKLPVVKKDEAMCEKGKTKLTDVLKCISYYE